MPVFGGLLRCHKVRVPLSGALWLLSSVLLAGGCAQSGGVDKDGQFSDQAYSDDEPIVGEYPLYPSVKRADERLDRNVFERESEEQQRKADQSGEAAFLLTREDLDAGRSQEGEALLRLGLQPTLYFDYDSDLLDEEAGSALRKHADYLRRQTGLVVIFEGHTDERGSRGYNLALGQRRAEVVALFLREQGIDGNRIRTRTYGEELPVLGGHDEKYWQYNRRVEIYYQDARQASAAAVE